MSAPLPSGEPTVDDPNRSIENLFGRNVVGIVAGALIFLGLVFLAILVVPRFTDVAKVVLMFGFSGMLAAGGYLLHRRFHNKFTESVLGTGSGALFISIMVTHLYFHFINEIVAFSLLFLWLVAAMFLARVTQSLLVAILAHAGMVISVVAAYAVVTDDLYVYLLVYQFVSTIAIIVGNILCCQRMYSFGLFMSLALLVYSAFTMLQHFVSSLGVDLVTELPPALIYTAFIVELLGASFIAYLLFVSTTRLQDKALADVVQLVNMLLWQAVVYVSVFCLISGFTAGTIGTLGPNSGQQFSYSRVLVAVGAAILVLFGVGFLSVLARRRLVFDVSLESVTVVTVALGATGYLLVQVRAAGLIGHTAVVLPWFALVGAFLLAGRALSDNHVLTAVAAAFIAVDEGVMLLTGYRQLRGVGTLAFPIAYLLVLVALAYWAYRFIPKDLRERYLAETRIGALIVIDASLAVIIVGAGWPYELDLLILLAVVELVVMHALRWDEPIAWYRVIEFLTGLVLAGMFSAELHPVSVPGVLIRIAASIVYLGLFLERVRLAAAANARGEREGKGPLENTDIEAVSGIVMTLVVVGTLNGLIPRFNGAYSLSLTFMVMALVMVCLGFWARIRPMRICGLAITIVSVLKLVIVDNWNQDTVLRVVALIGGGLICFGISALYNFTVKRVEGGAVGQVGAAASMREWPAPQPFAQSAPQTSGQAAPPPAAPVYVRPPEAPNLGTGTDTGTGKASPSPAQEDGDTLTGGLAQRLVAPYSQPPAQDDVDDPASE
jgi:hypothetical protein